MRKPIIAGNWKMNLLSEPAKALATGILNDLRKNPPAVEVVICPPMTQLTNLVEIGRGSGVGIGAQNLHWADDGAYTGEISAPMIRDLGCDYVIIGHSERRQFFAESNDSVNKKLKAALHHGLTPIVCVGERLEERESGITEEIVQTQVEGAFLDIPREDALKVVIAYEPVWAIGTGKTATPSQAQDVHAFIRSIFSAGYDQTVADAIRIQYGGSVKPENVDELMACPDIDGALVGGASLKVESFCRIIRFQ